MGEPVTEVHGDERDDLDRFAGARGLLHKDVFGSAADVGYEANLVRTELFGGGFHLGISKPVWR
jgi:hypothetical protein